MAAFAIGTWLCAGVAQRSGPSAASLSLISGSRTPASHIFSLKATALNANSSSGILHCSFLSNSSSPSTLSASSFSGLSLGLDFNSKVAGVSRSRRAGFVIRAGKYTLCQTKRNRSRKSLARTHGFRRMRTTSGRALLKRRRDKGRWNLCPKSNPNSGKRA